MIGRGRGRGDRGGGGGNCVFSFWSYVRVCGPPSLRHEDEINNPAYRVPTYVGVLKLDSRVPGTSQLAT